MSATRAEGEQHTPRLFEPFTLRGVTLKTVTWSRPSRLTAARNGVCDDFHLVHLGRFALGGAGLVMIGGKRRHVYVTGYGSMSHWVADLVSRKSPTVWGVAGASVQEPRTIQARGRESFAICGSQPGSRACGFTVAT